MDPDSDAALVLMAMSRGFSRREALYELPLRFIYQIEHIILIEKGYDVVGSTQEDEVVNAVLEATKWLQL